MSFLVDLRENWWTLLGVAGGVLFFGRFYVQWIVSEWRRESVIPVSFWYMSIAGVLLLFPYAVERVSPGGTLGLSFNLVVYVRNLVHIRRAEGTLTPAWSFCMHAAAAVLSTAALALTAVTWHRGYESADGFLFWSAVWAVGQGLFFMRFLVQWLATEFARRSVVPRAFWFFGIAGTVFHAVYFLYRRDWILAVGTIADGLVYVRNLYLGPVASQRPGQGAP